MQRPHVSVAKLVAVTAQIKNCWNILTITDEFIKPTILFLHKSAAVNVGSTQLHVEQNYNNKGKRVGKQKL